MVDSLCLRVIGRLFVELHLVFRCFLHLQNGKMINLNLGNIFYFFKRVYITNNQNIRFLILYSKIWIFCKLFLKNSLKPMIINQKCKIRQNSTTSTKKTTTTTTVKWINVENKPSVTKSSTLPSDSGSGTSKCSAKPTSSSLAPIYN